MSDETFNNKILSKLYKNQAKVDLQGFIKNCVIMTFRCLQYVHKPLMDTMLSRFCHPCEQMVDVVILLVEQMQHVKELMKVITTAYIANLYLELMHIFHVSKNWNSHGAILDAVIGNSITACSCGENPTSQKTGPQF